MTFFCTTQPRPIQVSQKNKKQKKTSQLEKRNKPRTNARNTTKKYLYTQFSNNKKKKNAQRKQTKFFGYFNIKKKEKESLSTHISLQNKT